MRLPHPVSTTKAGPALTLEGFGVAFGSRIVLNDVNIEIPRRGLTVLVGPGGSGKSTLLRTLAGLNAAHPALSTWGVARLDGQPLVMTSTDTPGEVPRGIGFVLQHARFFVDSVRENLVSCLPQRSLLDQATQNDLICSLLVGNGLGALTSKLGDNVSSLPTSLQRRLSIVRAIVSDPSVLFADEPTAGLEDDESTEVLALLRSQARQRAVVFVTHNQKFARASGGTVALLAGGCIQESGDAHGFFAEPKTGPGRSFVQTGGCSTASPNAQREDLSSSAPPARSPTPPPTVVSRFAGPRGFFWVTPGRLGGVPRPGIVESFEDDVEGLRRLGVSTLVCLEETTPYTEDDLRDTAIDLIRFPIVDMGVPTLSDALHLCATVDQLLSDKHVVAMHCRAGQGRTGTMLAAKLVYDGVAARTAIERLRALNPKCIESDAQVQFLSAFEGFLRRTRTTH